MARTAPVSALDPQTREALRAALAALEAASQALAAVAAAHTPAPAPKASPAPEAAGDTATMWGAYRPDTAGMSRAEAKAARQAAFARMQADLARGAPKAPKAAKAAKAAKAGPKGPKAEPKAAEPARPYRPMHDPAGPATASQLWFLHLLLQVDTRTPEYARLTKAQAAARITALKAAR